MPTKNFDQQLLVECLDKIRDNLPDIIIDYVKNNDLNIDEKEFMCQIVVNYIDSTKKNISSVRNNLKNLYRQLEQDEIEYNK